MLTRRQSMVSLLTVCVVALAAAMVGGFSHTSVEEPGSGSDGILPDREPIVFHLETEKEQYVQGERVVIETWFSNSGTDPVIVATYTSGCMLEVTILDEFGNLVYNGTQFLCLGYYVGDIVAKPGVDTPFAEWEWDLHYRIVETGPDDSPVLSRTDEIVPPGNYVIKGRAIGTPYMALDEISVS